jgi:GNAT superfamily N-acetyltransferase
MIEIRKLRKKDFKAFTELFEQVDELHRNAHPEYFRKPKSILRTKDYFEELLNDPTILLLGAMSGKSDLLGLVHAILKSHPLTEIHVPGQYVLLDNLVVSKDARRQGVGTALFAATQEWATQMGAPEIQLKVYRFNKTARTFYKRLGFASFAYAMRKR